MPVLDRKELEESPLSDLHAIASELGIEGYRRLRREVAIARNKAELSIQLERWIDPAASGFYSGDHHIHGAGCAHYTSPTEGVTPQDMFKQVEGED